MACRSRGSHAATGSTKAAGLVAGDDDCGGRRHLGLGDSSGVARPGRRSGPLPHVRLGRRVRHDLRRLAEWTCHRRGRRISSQRELRCAARRAASVRRAEDRAGRLFRHLRGLHLDHAELHHLAPRGAGAERAVDDPWPRISAPDQEPAGHDPSHHPADRPLHDGHARIPGQGGRAPPGLGARPRTSCWKARTPASSFGN